MKCSPTLRKAEAVYYSKSGFFGCDEACQKAYDQAHPKYRHVSVPLLEWIHLRWLAQVRVQVALARRCSWMLIIHKSNNMLHQMPQHHAASSNPH